MRGLRDKLRVICLVGFFCAVLWGLFHILSTSDPKYQSQALASYLLNHLKQDDIHKPEVMAAFRNADKESWPVALRLLRADKSSLVWRMRLLLAKQPLIKYELPPEPHWVSTLGSIGFEALGTNGAPAIPELAEMLKQPHYAKRAAEALICTGPASLPTLTNRLASGTPTECAGVLFALTQLCAQPRYVEYSDQTFWLRPVVPYVVRLANDPAMNISGEALKAMETWPTNATTLLDFESLLRSPNWGVRHSAVRWLRLRHPDLPEARALLAQATNDPYWLVQRSAEDALRTLSPLR